MFAKSFLRNSLRLSASRTSAHTQRNQTFAAQNVLITPFTRNNSTINVPASLVKKLRDATGAPFIECKKALVFAYESDNKSEVEAMASAQEWLRKRGTALAANRAGRTATEGVVVITIDKDSKKGVILEVNCETDFVSRNNVFLVFAARTALAALNENNLVSKIDNLGNANLIEMEQFNNVLLPDGPNTNNVKKAVHEELVDVITTTRENVKVRRAAFIDVKNKNNSFISSYVHNELPIPSDVQEYVNTITDQGIEIRFGGAAALTAFELKNENKLDDELKDLSKKIAMQTVAGRPEYLKRDNVPKDIVDKEINNIKTSDAVVGKDSKIIDNLIKGRMNKFYEANVLLEQQFLITNDSKKGNIQQLLDSHASKPTISHMIRFTRGEGVEEVAQPAPAA